MLRIRFYILIFCLSVAFHLSSQSYHFKNYTVENGLPYIQIFTIYQDSKGYLWSGGYGGLSRFDGLEFLNFSPKNGLRHHWVSSLKEDLQGRLWVGTMDGISIYENEKFTSLTESDGLPDNFILSLECDNTGKIWIGTRKGLCYYEDGKIHKISKCKGIEVRHLLRNNNQMYAGTEIGLMRWNNLTFDEEYFEKTGKTCSDVNRLCIDIKNNLWAGTSSGLYWYDKNDKQLTRFTIANSLIDENILSLYADEKGNTWVGTKSGLMKFNGTDFSYRKVTADYNANNIRCLTSDMEGNMWIGTHAGLFRFRNEDFVSYGPHDGLSNTFVFPIIRDSNKNLWVGTDGGGLFKYDRGYFKNYRTKDGLASLTVNSIIEESENKLLLGTTAGLNILRGEIISKVKSLHDTNITCIYKTKTGDTWVAIDGGTALFSGEINENSQPIAFYSFQKNQNTIQCWTFCEDAQGKLWAGTYFGGFYQWNGNNWIAQNEKFKIKSNSIFAIESDTKNNLYLSSFEGVYRIHLPSGKIDRFSEENGLSSDLVYSLLLSKDEKHLWAGTNQGACRINLHKYHSEGKKEIFVFGKNEGFKGVECNSGGVWEDDNSEIWFGTVNGLIKYNPKEFFRNSVESKLNFIHIRLGYKDTLLADGVELPHDMNNISFHYRGICFTNPEKVKYVWKLEGFDPNWSPESKVNFATFSNLPPGKYTFKVRSCNNENVWNLDPIEFSFVIAAPFYKRWWFIAATILFISAIVVIVFRFRVHQIKKEQTKEARRLVEISKNELKALRAQMNPHFLFNSLNSIMNYIIHKKDDEAIFYLNKFARLMRMILNNSEKQSVTLREEIDAIKLYVELEQMRFNNKFKFTCTIDENIDLDYEEIPTMLIQPYIENAILHGLTPSAHEGLLELNIIYKGNFLVCSVTDNGIGRKKSQEMRKDRAKEHRSLGMKISKERLRLLNQINQSSLSLKIHDLQNQNNEAAGTKVEIFVPIIHE